jgi:hypothetical protein
MPTVSQPPDTFAEPLSTPREVLFYFRTVLIITLIAYSDTTLVWSGPVKDLDKLVSMKHMACADSVTTSDGGKTWKIPNIHVEKSNAPEQFVKGVKTLPLGSNALCK